MDRSKILIIFLAAVLLLTAIAGCGPGAERNNTGFVGFTAEVSGFKIKFNEATRSSMRGTPLPPQPDAYSEEISLSDTNDFLGIDLRRCIPDSLSDLNTSIEAGYFPHEGLAQLNIWIHDPEREPGSASGKSIFISINSKLWSEYLHPLGHRDREESWPTISSDVTMINGVTVLFEVRPATIGFDNAVYVAQFTIENLDYDDSESGMAMRRLYGKTFYVRSRMGVTAEEFAWFVVELIREFTNPYFED